MYEIGDIISFKMIDRATEKVVLEGEGLKSYKITKVEDKQMFSVGDVIRTNPRMYDGHTAKRVCAKGYPTYIDFFKENNIAKYQDDYAYGEGVPEGLYTIKAVGKHSIAQITIYVIKAHSNDKIYLMSNLHQEMELIKQVEINKEDSNMAEEMINNEGLKKPKAKAEVREITYKATRRPFVEVSKTTGHTVKDTSFTLPELKEKVIYSDRAVIVFLDDGTRGVAKCHPEDEYNPTTGVKIAYTRAKIKSMQKELKKLCKPDNKNNN